ncbi:hypothetical protein M422DRAFT_776236 [Sphaerobolus stellatus SS14]|nr:hypothetical protein M422DRAFT_776236 [Sphaerobolus stellatus SS14]
MARDFHRPPSAAPRLGPSSPRPSQSLHTHSHSPSNSASPSDQEAVNTESIRVVLQQELRHQVFNTASPTDEKPLPAVSGLNTDLFELNSDDYADADTIAILFPAEDGDEIKDDSTHSETEIVGKGEGDAASTTRDNHTDVDIYGVNEIRDLTRTDDSAAAIASPDGPYANQQEYDSDSYNIKVKKMKKYGDEISNIPKLGKSSFNHTVNTSSRLNPGNRIAGTVANELIRMFSPDLS